MAIERAGALQGKVAIVTGVGSGIGKAVCARFAREGARVVGADIDPAAGSRTVADLREAGMDAAFVRCDVSDEEQVKAMVDTAVQAYGRLDILHNNAGIMPTHVSIEETPFKIWRRVMAVDLDSVFLGCKYAVPVMKKSGGGRIMNTASLAGIRGFMWGLHYAAAKGGVVQLSISLGNLLEPDGIKVNAICPTGTRTNLGKGYDDIFTGNDPKVREAMARRPFKTPVYGGLAPEDIARAAFFLATRAEFTAGALLISATPESKPDYYVTFGYKWEPLKEIAGIP